ncbi:MAG: GerMN domain-containing protein [Actinomycetota bacterium]
MTNRAHERPARGRRVVAALRAMTATVFPLLVAGCGIPTENSPRELPTAQADVFGRVQSGDEAAGSNRIFLLAPADADEAERLRSVSRDVEAEPGALLRSLFAGPNTEESDSGIDTALPVDLELLTTPRSFGQVLTVNVSDAFGELTPDALRFAVAQIVTTATDIDGVGAVTIQVDGQDRVWPIGNQELVDRPLTPYDYPGFVESTQPAFPSLPSDIN